MVNFHYPCLLVLAYLRPSGLWYQRPGMRHWFEAAAEVFTTTYRQAMLELGVANTVVDGILQRSRLYEAALLFKIATRRVNVSTVHVAKSCRLCSVKLLHAWQTM